MLLDFNEENRTPDDHKRLQKLRDEIAKRYPDALPDPATREPIYRVGHIITSSPVAISVEAKPAVKAAMLAVGVKLAHALYYREMKRCLTSNHRFFTSVYQLQRLGTEDMTAYFKKMLPDFRIGRRPNIAKYGNRFGYMSGCKPEEDFFLFAAQFGYGLVVWGMARPADMELNESNDALLKMNWRDGGCGLGAGVP